MVEVIDVPIEDIYTHQLGGMNNARVQLNGVSGNIVSKGTPSPHLVRERLLYDEVGPTINIVPGDEILVGDKCENGNVILHRYIFRGDYGTLCMSNSLLRQTTR